MLNLFNYHSDPSSLTSYENRLKLIPELAYREARNKKQRIPELEPTILKDPQVVVNYIHSIIKQPWKEAEPILMKEPYSAYEYAHHILKSRWKQAEPTILKSTYTATLYAKEVIKNRWPELEKILLKIDPNDVTECLDRLFIYFEDVVKESWPEAEEIFKRYPKSGYLQDYYTLVRLSLMKTLKNYGIDSNVIDAYTDFFRRFNFMPNSMLSVATTLLKQRWIEAEPQIKKDPETWQEYKEHFNIKD